MKIFFILLSILNINANLNKNALIFMDAIFISTNIYNSIKIKRKYKIKYWIQNIIQPQIREKNYKFVFIEISRKFFITLDQILPLISIILYLDINFNYLSYKKFKQITFITISLFIITHLFYHFFCQSYWPYNKFDKRNIKPICFDIISIISYIYIIKRKKDSIYKKNIVRNKNEDLSKYNYS